MNALAEMAYKETAEKAKLSLEGAGYDVAVHPASRDFPAPLRSSGADLVARKGDEVVVVGIRAVPSTPAENQRLEKLADEVRKHAGWRFHLYLAQPRQELIDAPLQPSSSELRTELALARGILGREGARAALIYGWALLEATSRLLVLDEAQGEARRYKPASIAASLVSEGFLGDADGDRLQSLAAARNQVAHGFTKADVSVEDVEWLLALSEKLLKEANQS